MRGLILLVAYVIGTCHGDVIIHQFPVNTVGQVSKELLLNCTVDLNNAGVLQWGAYFLNGDPQDKSIYTGQTNGGTIVTEFIGIYEVDQDNLHNLKVLDMSYDKAGRYTCSIIDASGSPPSQEVQVAAVSKLKCPESGSEYVEGDTPVLVCSLEINGDPSLAPILTWERDGTPVEGTPGITTAPPPPSPRPVSLQHNLTVEYTDDDVPYTCRLRFDEGSELESTPPVYTDTCTTSFSVLFGVRNVTTYPAPENPHNDMKVGQNITCHALGTAPVNYVWEKVEGNADQDLIFGQMLLITEDMIDGLNRYYCTARNSLNGQEHSASSNIISFHAESSGGLCGGLNIGDAGEISSPNYPNDYPFMTICKWTIRPTGPGEVSLEFIDFRLTETAHCQRDFIKICDGNCGSADVSWEYGPFCGHEDLPIFVSTVGFLEVIFNSDDDVADTGFYARWQRVSQA